MQEKQVYEYAIVRVVPKVEREEFINVGVILFSKRKRFLDIKCHIDEKKLKALCEEIDIAEVKNYINSWEMICQGDKKGGKIAQLEKAERFRWLTAVKSTILQSSRVHPGLSANPDKELATLFEKYVL